MKLQKATRCALYAVLELAKHPDRQISAADIAEKYDISANHLAKVLRELTRAGLIESVRGAGGGYSFSGNANRTSLYQIVAMFEDLPGEGFDRPEPGENTDIGAGLNLILTEIDDISRATLRSVTITTLLKISERQAAAD